VRKNLIHFLNNDFDYLIILSGDQLYRMDFRPLIGQHVETVRTSPLPPSRSSGRGAGLGIMQMDENLRVTRFEEKPRDPALQDALRLDPKWYDQLGITGSAVREELFLASMGIYVFNRELILSLLDNPLTDFGKHYHSPSHPFPPRFRPRLPGLLEDIGTIRSFFEANLDIVSELPRFQFSLT